ncbi:hypothetical protein NSA42_17610 [Paeniclostridium sordellii]|uniref:hypothetical protein n=1 Tax=Paraclostridium sordellii TaxID=1505 RepID=UPI002149C9C8|nr:hypothetical protein [Paeniclostridium sordellii]MCR1851094.1 hypothetical protein [Paeniclostridium sordellii]
MKEKPYNLQVPIDKNLELALKKLAEEDDRTLRAYCRRILQEHVKNVIKETPMIEEVIEIKEDPQAIETVIEDIKPKKKKVGKLTKK